MPVSAEYLPLATAALAFLFVMLLAWGWVLYGRYKDQRRSLVRKILQSGLHSPDGKAAAVATESVADSKIADFLGRLGKQVAPGRVMNPMDYRTRFWRAGFRGEKVVAVFWGIKVLLAVSLPLALVLINSALRLFILHPTTWVLYLCLLALIGFYAPDLWLYNRGLQRKEAILDGFPDALDLLVVCVEAGMGLDAAMNRVSQEIDAKNPVLSEELTIFSLEMRGGMQRRDALKNLALRTDLVEINRLTTLLIQTDRFGTSVASALKVFSDTLRTQRYQRAEEMAGKIPVKLLFPMILFIFPALFVVIMGPAAIRIYHSILMR